MPHSINLPYKAILFDLDGTVLDTLDGLTYSINYIFGRHHLATQTPDQVRAGLGYGYAGLIARTAPDAPADLQAQMAEEFNAYYTAHCRSRSRPYSGIPSLLQELRRRGCRSAIVSNKGHAAVTALHDEFFAGLVDFSIGASPEIPRKPAPDMIYEALSRLGCRPDEAVYIGDSEVDRETAANAGLPSILVSWGFRSKDFLETVRPDFLISSCSELKDLLLPSEN